MLLLKEKGLCGMLNPNKTKCCITLHNAVASTEEAQGRIKETAANHSKPKKVL